VDEHEGTDAAGVRVETLVFELTDKLKMTQVQGVAVLSRKNRRYQV
jgi:hypothetical protein